MSDHRRDLLKKYWFYLFTIVVLLDLWLGHLTSILSFLALRGYFIFIEQFDHHIFHFKFSRSNKTDNEESLEKVEEEESRLRVRYNFP